MELRSFLVVFGAVGAALGCGGGDIEAFEDGGAGGEDAGGSGGDGAAMAGGATAGGAGGGGTDGPMINIRFRANTDPFAHADGLSGQTPISHSSGVRKLQLLRGPNDPEPYTVFDFGQDYVEVGYNHGDDTLVYSVPVTDVPEDTFTVARVVHSHVRYRVASRMHATVDLDGEFNNVQVLSDGTMLDGSLHDHGYFEYVFEAAGMQFPVSGTNAPVPVFTAGGFSVTLENGEWTYEFPTSLPVSHDIDEPIDVVMEVNMFESFRWQDQSQTGFASGVFDTTPTSSEPVLRFGANTFELTIE